MVNDGVERHDELLALWCEQGGSDHTFEVIDVATLDGMLVARRSNCVLATAKLHAAGLAMPHVEQALPRLLSAYAANLRTAPKA